MLHLIYIFVTGFRVQSCERSLGLVGSVDLLISPMPRIKMELFMVVKPTWEQKS